MEDHMEDPLGTGLTRAQLRVLRLLLKQTRELAGVHAPPEFTLTFQGAIDVALVCVDRAEAFQYSPALLAALKNRSGGDV